MPVPEYFSRLRIYSGAALFLLAVASPSQAQFAGGIADGYAGSGLRYAVPNGSSAPLPPYTASAVGGDGYGRAGFQFLRLDGAANAVVLFTAGVSRGDGYDRNGSSFLQISGPGLPTQVYTASAGGGDGYSLSGLAFQPLNGSAPVLALFKGGEGDGYDFFGLEKRVIDPAAASFAIYNGGEGDGYDTAGLRFGVLDGELPPQVMYTATASGGDGYDLSGIRHFAVTPSEGSLELYLSSATGGDGYDRAGFAFQSLNGQAAFSLSYVGADGDGYSGNGLHHQALSIPVALPAALYAGSEGDGYDTEGLAFVQYLGGGEAASGITFSGWRFSRFSEDEINSGLADPGTDADGDGLANLIEFALGSDPREPDASAFGPQFRLSNLTDLGFPALADRHLTALVRRNPLALDASLQIEVADDVSVLWSVNETVLVESTPGSFIVRDQFGVNAAPRRSMRLRATLTP